MLFNEIYGSYYQVTALVLREAVRDNLTREGLTELVQKRAFSESVLALPEGLQGERWRLLHRDMTTPIQEGPTMPLTLLQKRWLKALLLDPRMQLFNPDMTGLEDVKPLFTPDMFVWFDRYNDGDDYADPAYAAHFRTILGALRERRSLDLEYISSRDRPIRMTVTPRHLEYSEKDDRFRLIASDSRRDWILNLSGIVACSPGDRQALSSKYEKKALTVTLELADRRNALERVLLHFSHLEKETERLDENRYRVTLHYDSQDETEMVIRILSFGPVIRVLEPPHFVELVKRRIERQMTFATFLPGDEAGKGLKSQTQGRPEGAFEGGI